MAKIAMVLTITFSLFLLTLARYSIDLPQIEISEESNTSLSLEDSNLNQSTDLKIPDPIKEELVLNPKIESKEEPNTSLSLEDPNPNHSTGLKISDPIKEEVEEDQQPKTLSLVDESDPGIIIGWDPREEEKPKEEKVIKKRRSKRSDESDSDSDSDSDDEEEEREMRKKKKNKKGKKVGFLRWFWKLINRFFD